MGIAKVVVPGLERLAQERAGLRAGTRGNVDCFRQHGLVAREGYDELEAGSDPEYRDPITRGQGGDEIERALLGAEAALGVLSIEDEGHEVQQLALARIGGRRRSRGRRRRGGHPHALVDESERFHFGAHAVLGDLHFLGAEVLDRPPLLVAHHEVEGHDARARRVGDHGLLGNGGLLGNAVLRGQGGGPCRCQQDQAQPWGDRLAHGDGSNMPPRVPRVKPEVSRSEGGGATEHPPGGGSQPHEEW